MPKLTIRCGDTTAETTFTATPLLGDVLAEAGFAVAQPCGGRGTCGKCAVLSLIGAVSPPNSAEQKAGTRLACQARLWGDCEAVLPVQAEWRAIQTGETGQALGHPMAGRYGAAVDLGTTTIVARVYDLATGETLGESAMLNPQTAVGADVMARISAALAWSLTKLQTQAQTAVLAAVAAACEKANIPGADALVVAGNTAMLYLLTGRSPDTLAVAPFQADHLFGEDTYLMDTPLYLPPCAGAFMGGDLTCAALSTELCEHTETRLLMDIGTNAELMLWHGGKLYATSASAGPVFEGGEISQGVGGVTGAIDKVWAENGTLGSHVLGGGKPIGICGSGIIDAVAALLRLGRIDKTGAADAEVLSIREGIRLTAKDIRAVQLAKGAIAAGVETLLDTAGIGPADVTRLELAGGFGSHLRVPSAVAIGLIPAALSGKAHAVGNASLAGAAALLLDTRLRTQAEQIAGMAQVIQLGGSETFEKRFLAAMDFPMGMG